ncbi:MAG: hypothetical protein HKN41_07830, partial [Ilumatobacter sp.]|nr:hypothetical protein [Ilumatobacter sp.]
EEMAAHYIAAIISHQPEGPYLIGGHCDGAWVAHEMARQLIDRGFEVRYLVMVDVAPPPQHIPTTAGLRRVVDRLRYYARDGRLIPAIRWQVKLRVENTLLLRFGSAASRRVRAIRLAHQDAYARYRFEHDPRAPLHLIRSTELAVLMDEISWYDELVERPDVEITDISSTHARLLHEPETIELADVMSRRMDTIDEPS